MQVDLTPNRIPRTPQVSGDAADIAARDSRTRGPKELSPVQTMCTPSRLAPLKAGDRRQRQDFLNLALPNRPDAFPRAHTCDLAATPCSSHPMLPASERHRPSSPMLASVAVWVDYSTFRASEPARVLWQGRAFAPSPRHCHVGLPPRAIARARPAPTSCLPAAPSHMRPFERLAPLHLGVFKH